MLISRFGVFFLYVGPPLLFISLPLVDLVDGQPSSATISKSPFDGFRLTEYVIGS